MVEAILEDHFPVLDREVEETMQEDKVYVVCASNDQVDAHTPMPIYVMEVFASREDAIAYVFSMEPSAKIIREIDGSVIFKDYMIFEMTVQPKGVYDRTNQLAELYARFEDTIEDYIATIESVSIEHYWDDMRKVEKIKSDMDDLLTEIKRLQ